MPRSDDDAMRAVTATRAKIDRHKRELARLEAELAELLKAAGLRPGDGSDQPALFEADPTPSMF
jgi:hypothetical protein